MYDELVKRLRSVKDSWQSEEESWMLQAADAIEELESACNRYEKDYKDLCAYLPKWIPVTERLPSGRVEVLVSSGIFAPLIEVAFYDGLFYSAWDGKTEIVAVTHWMPLPEPPKEV